MDFGLGCRRLCHVNIQQLLSIVGIITFLLALVHLFAYPYGNYLSFLSYGNVGLDSLPTGSEAFNSSKLVDSDIIHGFRDDDMRQIDARVEINERNLCLGSTFHTDGHVNFQKSAERELFRGKSNISSDCNPRDMVYKQTGFGSLGSEKSQPKINNSELSLLTNDMMAYNPALRKRGGVKAMSITQMNSFILTNSVEKKPKRARWSSRHDRELQDAKYQIQNAAIRRNISEDLASLFRNYSSFERSYELMERKLKVYVYREGQQPIFHLPYLRGIYASEGWFMKLMEKNKKIVVKEPKKAHLFYLPFSSVKLRNALNGSLGNAGRKYMENHLKNYVDMVATKYRLWNKTGGADHFLVACHDWALQATSKIFGNCIRVLCNSNIARGFRIGKDVSLPVTYIRSSENPLKDIEGNNSPSNRPILAFFAGAMHGNVRPMLLHYWHNKEPDMKIVGPMPRDVEGKAKYRELMKSSKYCICAKGYEVHTPRVVESIYYECVPVIISDNYVPPLFEVLNWESFALFVLEDDIPNLRDILLSVPEGRYMTMQRRLKMVRRYFVWHKAPQKYDLFHMILHSVWFNRVFHASS